MQTTLRMNDDLIRRAKALAAVDGQSLTAFIEDAIRRRLEADICWRWRAPSGG